jgi:hypothetical protein
VNGEVEINASDAFKGQTLTIDVAIRKDWRFRLGVLLLRAGVRVLRCGIEIKDADPE